MRAVSEAEMTNPQTRAHAPRLRLTTRGRRVFAALAALLLVGALSVAAALGAPDAQASVGADPVKFGYVAVPAGASLWSIAAGLDPAADTRDVIAEIVRLNQLPSADVYAGDLLAVPLEYREVVGVLTAHEAGVERASSVN